MDVFARKPGKDFSFHRLPSQRVCLRNRDDRVRGESNTVYGGAPTCDRGGDTRARNPEAPSTPRAPWTDPGMTERAQHPRRECPPSPSKNTVDISDQEGALGRKCVWGGREGLAARSRDPKASVRVGAPLDTGQIILRGSPRPRGARRSPTCGSVSRRRRIAWQGRNFLARASPRTCGTSPARLPFPSSRGPAS